MALEALWPMTQPWIVRYICFHDMCLSTLTLKKVGIGGAQRKARQPSKAIQEPHINVWHMYLMLVRYATKSRFVRFTQKLYLSHRLHTVSVPVRWEIAIPNDFLTCYHASFCPLLHSLFPKSASYCFLCFSGLSRRPRHGMESITKEHRLSVVSQSGDPSEEGFVSRLVENDFGTPFWGQISMVDDFLLGLLQGWSRGLIKQQQNFSMTLRRPSLWYNYGNRSDIVVWKSQVSTMRLYLHHITQKGFINAYTTTRYVHSKPGSAGCCLRWTTSCALVACWRGGAKLE